MKRTIFLFAVILFSSMAVSAQDASLYKRLGGYSALAAVTDDLSDGLPRISSSVSFLSG